MKKILGLALVLSFSPILAHAAGFDRLIGQYEVVSAPDYGSEDLKSLCPFRDASIVRMSVQGREALVLQASGKGVSASDSGSCNVSAEVGLSFDGVEGTTCRESEDRVLCERGQDVYEVRASSPTDGSLVLNFISSGSQPSNVTWVLRKK